MDADEATTQLRDWPGVYFGDENQVIGVLGPDGEAVHPHPERSLCQRRSATFCDHVLFFDGMQSAEAWTNQHPGTPALPLDEAAAIGRETAQRLRNRTASSGGVNMTSGGVSK